MRIRCPYTRSRMQTGTGSKEKVFCKLTFNVERGRHRTSFLLIASRRRLLWYQQPLLKPQHE